MAKKAPKTARPITDEPAVSSEPALLEEVQSTDSKPKKRGWFKRMIHSKKFWWILLALVIIDIVLVWLFTSYRSPIPPRWIGVSYYRYDLPKPLALPELSLLPEQLKSIQTAILVYKPASAEAKQLLPQEVLVNTYTLSDQSVLRSQLATSLATYLTGQPREKQAAAQRVLANPEQAILLSQVYLLVTVSPNQSVEELALNQKINQTGIKIEPSEYETKLAQLRLGATLSPAAGLGLAANTMEFTVDKPSVYALYKNESAQVASVSAGLNQPFNDFISVNDQLVPLRAGRSPLLVLEPGQYRFPIGMVASPIKYFLALQTVEGLPYITKSVGHGWASVSQQENGHFYPLMTMSLFNFIDDDNKQDLNRGEFTNIATYTNLWINQPDDWVRAEKSLNKIPLPDGPSATTLRELTPIQAKKILLERAWYFPNYSTQDLYMQYLVESMMNATDLKTKATLAIEIVHVKIQNVMNKSFWGAIQMMMNQGATATSYNGITSNCVAYSADFWNVIAKDPTYDPRMLRLVAVPGKLYHILRREDWYILPDATTLPEDQQNVPYDITL